MLSDAQPFEYMPDALSDDVTELAARSVRMTGNEPGGFAINPNGQMWITSIQPATSRLNIMEATVIRTDIIFLVACGTTRIFQCHRSVSIRFAPNRGLS